MRIVSGKYGGRRLTAPKGDQTRPTADRVRESLFSILYDVEDWTVLDLFAGTGAVGLEALSRGANHVIFVEHSRPALVALDKNLSALGVTSSVAEVYREDVVSALARLKPRSKRFELIYADPPYAEVEKLAPALLSSAAHLLAPTGRLIIEHSGRAPPPTPPNTLVLSDVRSYGEAKLAFYTLPVATL